RFRTVAAGESFARNFVADWPVRHDDVPDVTTPTDRRADREADVCVGVWLYRLANHRPAAASIQAAPRMGRVRRRRGYPFAVSERATAAQFVPDSDDLTVLAYAAQGCRGCDLHRGATQVVFGDGPRRADLMLVGEQPGDQED